MKKERFSNPREAERPRRPGLRGFTLIELLVVIAASAIIFVIALNAFRLLRDNEVLDTAAETVNTVVSGAKFKTLSSSDMDNYGVHFETGRVVLFKGNIYAEASSTNVVSALHYLVEISSVNLNGGGSDAVFKMLTGETDNYGTVVIRLKNDHSKTKTVNIEKSGAVNFN